MTNKQQILALLAQVDTLLAEATCEGMQLAETWCYEEVTSALSTLEEQVGYYVD